MDEGLISKTFSWLAHGKYSETTLQEWLMGLVLILIIAFLWSTVVRQVVEPAAEIIGDAIQ